MSAVSISAADRQALGPDQLERLDELLDFRPEIDEPLPGEWPHEYPPGFAVSIDGDGPIVLEEVPHAD